jgi:hypothetical protein
MLERRIWLYAVSGLRERCYHRLVARPSWRGALCRLGIPLRDTASALRPDAGVPKRSPQAVARDDQRAQGHAIRWLLPMPHRDSDAARASSDRARTTCLCTGCNGSGRVGLPLVVRSGRGSSRLKALAFVASEVGLAAREGAARRGGQGVLKRNVTSAPSGLPTYLTSPLAPRYARVPPVIAKCPGSVDEKSPMNWTVSWPLLNQLVALH